MRRKRPNIRYLKEPNLDGEQQGVVAGRQLGGGNTDTTADVGFLQNLLG